MAKDTDVNVISTPQILTMDNKEAEIKVGKNVPYLTKYDTRHDESEQSTTHAMITAMWGSP
ncbi:MAG: hypothetical protein M0C28_22500 [Candidatus Moduliflexus flocculans]|nr:hypothetical protein [Candidatus Moduliflexus flocculans]